MDGRTDERTDGRTGVRANVRERERWRQGTGVGCEGARWRAGGGPAYVRERVGGSLRHGLGGGRRVVHERRQGGEVGVPGTGPRRSCYSDTGMLAMPLSKVTEILRKYPRKRGGPCRGDSSETRVAFAEVLVRGETGELRDRPRAACISPRVRKRRDRERLWGAASRGASPEMAIRNTLRREL